MTITRTRRDCTNRTSRRRVWNVTSCLVGGGYTQMSGTSMATPCAAGVCALMFEKNPKPAAGGS